MILALDLGSRTGWALWDGVRTESGVQIFDLKRGESPGMRFVRFNGWLSSWATDGHRPSLVAYEQTHHRGARLLRSPRASPPGSRSSVPATASSTPPSIPPR